VILLGNTLAALAKILHLVLTVYLWVIILRALFSWIYVPSLHQAARVLYRLTEPVLRPIRRLVPPSRLGGLDISPIIAALVVIFLDSVLVDSLALYAHRLLRGVVEVSF
jgi:YggT family protein